MSPPQPHALALLRWYLDTGVDAAVDDVPANSYAAKTRQRQSAPAAPPPARDPSADRDRQSPAPPTAGSRPSPASTAPGAVVSDAKAAAAACQTLEELKAALAAFDGCALRDTAANLVFADGAPDSGLMFVGEAPGADEDRQGLPFVGRAGQLLDRMLAAIDRDRDSAYISNILPWRPPGNRKPTTQETETCLPFIRRHIELARPRVLVLLGGTAATALLGTTTGITRIRGRWMSYDTDSGPIDAMPTFHPAYLLRSPGLKRHSWRDLLAIRNRLRSME